MRAFIIKHFHFRFTWDDFSFCWLILPVLAFALISKYAPRPMPENPLQKIKIYQDFTYYKNAETLYDRLLAIHPLDIDLNYQYLANHCESISRQEKSKENDRYIGGKYMNLTLRAETADLGNYGLGYLKACHEKYHTALTYYLKVKNTSQKYLNNSIGHVYEKLGKPESAENYFKREIELGGNLGGAVTNLSNIYMRQGDIKNLQALVNGEQTESYVNSGAKGYAALRSWHILEYAYITYIHPFTHINGYAALCALLIGGVWLIYLRRINAFSQLPLYLSVIIIVAGIFFTLTCTFLYDLGFLINPIQEGENLYKDFIYFILHVGVIEEFIKFLPVFLLVLITKEKINDPLDVVYLGGLSALSFATLEDSLYFSVYGLRIIPSRFILSTVLHMAFTMLICYIWARARFIKASSELLALSGGYCLAVLAHGLFDFLIISEIPALFLLDLVEVMVLAFIFGLILDRCILFSPRYAFIQTSLTRRRITNFQFLYFISALLITISYVYNNFHYGGEVARLSFIVVFFFVLFGSLVIIPPLAKAGLPPGPATYVLRREKSYKPVLLSSRSMHK